MREENELVKEFRAIRAEYAYNPSVMSLDDERVARLKEIIDTKLSQVDRTLILLYVDCQSYRKLGAKMHLSHMTCRREILRIERIILTEMNKNRYKVGDIVYVDWVGEDSVSDHYEPEYDTEPSEEVIKMITHQGEYLTESGWTISEARIFPSMAAAWKHQQALCSRRLDAFKARLETINKEIANYEGIH